ncbi:IS110 family transposase [Pseudonocardia sp. EV170527-09]|uniref:IS110 family transposase n=1 Tax=Pseudonocardia sp. EV170527-09 TaxID=2603411 RepID=UPI0011F20BB2|nr:IS110 family transposase [Pseudonocardia sp. EV170527-09]
MRDRCPSGSIAAEPRWTLLCLSVEVGAVKRSRGAKNDHIDAVRAARTALAREFQTLPRARGLREALRMVLATRAAVLVSRTKAINELKSLIIVAPEGTVKFPV